jgi:hypothetical protein
VGFPFSYGIVASNGASNGACGMRSGLAALLALAALRSAMKRRRRELVAAAIPLLDFG